MARGNRRSAPARHPLQQDAPALARALRRRTRRLQRGDDSLVHRVSAPPLRRSAVPQRIAHLVKDILEVVLRHEGVYVVFDKAHADTVNGLVSTIPLADAVQKAAARANRLLELKQQRSDLTQKLYEAVKSHLGLKRQFDSAIASRFSINGGEWQKIPEYRETEVREIFINILVKVI